MFLEVLLRAAFVPLVAIAGLFTTPTAGADDPISMNAFGVYEVGKKIWVVDSCQINAGHCIRVTEFNSSDAQRKRPLWTSDAYWVVGSWIMVPVESTRKCKDGSSYPVAYNYSWDAASNTGWFSYRNPGACKGEKAKTVASAFTLNLIENIPPGPETGS